MVELEIRGSDISIATSGDINVFKIGIGLSTAVNFIQTYTNVCLTVTLQVPLLINKNSQIALFKQQFICQTIAIDPGNYYINGLIMECPGSLDEEKLDTILKGTAIAQFYQVVNNM